MKIRFRRFRLISIDTHLWSELTSRRIIGGEGRQKFGGLPVSVWLHEQVDDPPESQRHEKSQVIDNSSFELISTVV